MFVIILYCLSLTFFSFGFSCPEQLYTWPSQLTQSGTALPSCTWVGGGRRNFPLQNQFGYGCNFHNGHIYKTAKYHDTYSMCEILGICVLHNLKKIVGLTLENGVTPWWKISGLWYPGHPEIMGKVIWNPIWNPDSYLEPPSYYGIRWVKLPIFFTQTLPTNFQTMVVALFKPSHS